MLVRFTAMQVAQTEVNGTLLDADFSPSDDLKMTVICSKQVYLAFVVISYIKGSVGLSTRADVVNQSALEGGEGEGVAEQWGGGWSLV